MLHHLPHRIPRIGIQHQQTNPLLRHDRIAERIRIPCKSLVIPKRRIDFLKLFRRSFRCQIVVARQNKNLRIHFGQAIHHHLMFPEMSAVGQIAQENQNIAGLFKQHLKGILLFPARLRKMQICADSNLLGTACR